MEYSEIVDIIAKHQHFLARDCDGWKNLKADFRKQTLAGVDLHGFNLSCVNFSYCDLSRADISHCALTGADFSYSSLLSAYCHHSIFGEMVSDAGFDVTGVSFYGANLEKTDFREAICPSSDFRFANLKMADFSHADVSNSVFLGASLALSNFGAANIKNADFSGTSFDRTNLLDTNLSEAACLPYIPMVCPEEGAFIGWKKCRNGRVAKLLIPEDAKRSSGLTRTCRCDKAAVLGIFDFLGNPLDETEAISCIDEKFVYYDMDVTIEKALELAKTML